MERERTVLGKATFALIVATLLSSSVAGGVARGDRTDTPAEPRAPDATALPGADLADAVPPFIDGVDGIATNGSAWDPDPSLWPHSAPIMLRGSQYGQTEAKIKLRMEGKGDPVSKRVPQQTCLVTDDSGSMAWNDPNGMRVTAMQFYIDQLSSPDEICVVAYSDRLPSGNLAEVRVALTTDYASAKSGVGQFVSSGGTPIAPALQVANDELIPKNKTGFAWAEILMTDGCYNTGGDPQLEVDRAALNRIRIFTIGLYPDPNSSDKQMCEPQLIGWAQQTGGKYYWVQDPNDLAQVYSDIAGYLSTLAGTAPKSGAPMVSLKLTDDIEAVNGSFRCDGGLCLDPAPNNGSPIADGNKGLTLEWYEPASSMATGQLWQVEFAVRAHRVGSKVKVNDISRSFVTYDRYDRLPAADALEQLYVYVSVPVHPRVIWTSPADGLAGVGATWPVQVRFDQTMDPALTAGSFSVSPPVPGGVSVSGDFLLFDHADPFAADTRYNVTISTLASSAAGVPMLAPHVFSFNTTPAARPPRVVATDPASASVSVPTDKVVTVLFDQAMDPATTIPALMPNRPFPAGSVVTVNGRELTWTHTEAFLPESDYLITIGASATSLAGVPMAEDHLFLFTTRAAPRPPRVIYSDPAPLEEGVELHRPVTVGFDKMMDPGSLRDSFWIDPEPQGGSLKVTDSYLAFAHTGPFVEGAQYTVVVTEDARSIDGVALEDPFVLTFRTLAVPVLPVPQVSMLPPDGSENVSRSTGIVLVFTEPMDENLTGRAVSVKPAVKAVAAWDAESKVLALQPERQLDPATVYVVNVSTGALSAEGVPLAGAFSGSFKTIGAAVGDDPPPGGGGLVGVGELPWAGLAFLLLVATLLSVFVLGRWKRRRDRAEELRRLRRTGSRDRALGGVEAGAASRHRKARGERWTGPGDDPGGGEGDGSPDGSVLRGAAGLARERRAAARRESAARRIASGRSGRRR